MYINADGTVFRGSTVDVKVAFGGERRTERYSLELVGGGTSTTPGKSNVNSLFGELNVPIRFGSRQDVSLTLSGAGRYDHYSGFGGTFNPQLGANLRLPSGLTLRGNYSEAYRAPDLLSLGLNTRAVILTIPNPNTGTETPLLVLAGGNPDLKPETAKTWTLGFDFAPIEAEWIRLSSSYFNISYRDRIDTPGVSFSTLLSSQDLLGPLLNQQPTENLLSSTYLGAVTQGNFSGIAFDPASQSFLSAFPGISYFDSRLQNIGSDKISGIDVGIEAGFPVSNGRIFHSTNVTYYFNFDRRVIQTGPAIDNLDRPEKLVDFRARSALGWKNKTHELSLFANYVDGYRDDSSTPSVRIGSWTTFDLDLAWNSASQKDLLSGFSATLSVQNVLNTSPPLYRSGNIGLNYDVVNGSGMGRYVSLRLKKRF